tara:strand:+ start:19328 stop:19657 length:330 start_codon:yes stop_codon:yes gene_type:complete
MFTQETIRTTIGVIMLIGTAAGLYVGVQTQQVAMLSKVESLVIEQGKLDKYDMQLQDQVDENRESLVRVETIIINSEKNYNRLTTTMDNLGKEIRTLSNTLIRMESKDG